jgi:hypothetical protein
MHPLSECRGRLLLRVAVLASGMFGGACVSDGSPGSGAPDATGGDVVTGVEGEASAPPSSADASASDDPVSISAQDGAALPRDAPAFADDAPAFSDDAPWAGDGGCAAIPTTDVPPYSSPASGTATGTSRRAAICPGGVYARVEPAGARYDTAPFFFFLSYTVGSLSVVEPFDFQSPPGASHGEVDVMVGLAAAAPGSYSSPAGSDCGALVFTYYLPVPPSVSCDGGVPPNCPKGCGTICSGFGCAPCTPQEPAVSFVGRGSANCIGSTQSPLGSWQLSLSAVTANDAGTGPGVTYFTPHGTFTANLVGADNASETMTITASF